MVCRLESWNMSFLFNVSWNFIERIVSLGLSFILSIYLAREFSVSEFGQYAYATSILSVATVAGHLGLSGLLVKNLIQESGNRDEILGSAFLVKLVGYMVGLIIMLFISYFLEENKAVSYMVALMGVSILFKALDVIDFYFQSESMFKQASLAKMAGSLVGNSLKVLIVFVSGSLVYLSSAFIFQGVLVAGVLVYFYSQKLKIQLWRASKERVINLVRDGGLVFIGSISGVLFLKIDQIMIRNMTGDYEAGIYSVATVLSEAWFLIPLTLITVYYPKLVALKERSDAEYRKTIQLMLHYSSAAGILLALIVTFFSQNLVEFFFGVKYLDSSDILVIHIWGLIFMSIRLVISKWIVIENLLIMSVVTQLLALTINIGLNLLLIPEYGAKGAAFSTLVSYFFGGYIVFWWKKETKEMFNMISKSLLSPYFILRSVGK